MSPLWLLAVILILAVAGALLGRNRSIACVNGNVAELHSQPGYYGSYVFIWTAIPAIGFMIAVLFAQPFINESVVDEELRSSYTQSCARAMSRIEGETDAEQPKICTDKQDYEKLDTRRALMQGVVDSVAGGLTLLSEQELKQLRSGLIAVRPTLAKHGVALAENVNNSVVGASYKLNNSRAVFDLVLIGGVAVLLALGFLLSYRRISAPLRARNRVEANIKIALIFASSIAILTTLGIVMSMLFEAIHFFGHVDMLDFFFGTTWDPRFSSVGRQVDSEGGTFGLIPLLWGTLYISLVALLVAVPIGLFAAIYMAEYASRPLRAIAGDFGRHPNHRLWFFCAGYNRAFLSRCRCLYWPDDLGQLGADRGFCDGHYADPVYLVPIGRYYFGSASILARWFIGFGGHTL